jgi:nucleotide-binding universal stress UspA family protein
MARLRPAEGDVIDGFVLGASLHRATMSSLWRVTRQDGARPGEPPLLMKIPSLAEGDDVSAIIGFELEQMILPRLCGPHVPRHVASGDFASLPHLVMEEVIGESLAAVVGRAPLPAEMVVDLGTRIARALQDLHRQHVLHLDLKPANIMLRPDGTVVFIDFGLSRHDELPDLLGEESDVPMGTGAYIAPEQVLGDRSEPRSDLFALGVILYELLTGVLPFGFPQRKAGMMTRLWRDPVPPRALQPDCPPMLQELVLQCLEVDPANRPSSAAQLAFALSHPDQVTLGPRATKLRRDSTWTVARRWLSAGRGQRTGTAPRIARTLAEAPIVLAAVDLAGGQDPLSDAIRIHAGRVLAAEPGARLACVTVLRTALLSLDTDASADGSSAYLQRLVELRAWAGPIAGGDTARVSFHVIEAVDAAAALVGYVRHNHIDHVVIGARASSALRRYLGSVSAQVVAEAPCTVTVVRVAGGSAQSEAD